MIKLTPKHNEFNILMLNSEQFANFKRQEPITFKNKSYQCFNGRYYQIYTKGVLNND